ncbi:MAG: cupin, partial [Rhizonema sp. NSF051]|nr:cupin [Rhizonema sp. NSF051]
NYISCLDRLYQQIPYYSLSVQAAFSRLALGTKTKFTNAKFQHVRFHDLPEAMISKIVVAGKKVFLKAIFWCVVDKLFTTETFAENDVLNWLPVLD